MPQFGHKEKGGCLIPYHPESGKISRCGEAVMIGAHKVISSDLLQRTIPVRQEIEGLLPGSG
jgi:hypothetical protein